MFKVARFTYGFPSPRYSFGEEGNIRGMKDGNSKKKGLKLIENNFVEQSSELFAFIH
jgi:hypothetical protein